MPNAGDSLSPALGPLLEELQVGSMDVVHNIEDDWEVSHDDMLLDVGSDVVLNPQVVETLDNDVPVVEFG